MLGALLRPSEGTITLTGISRKVARKRVVALLTDLGRGWRLRFPPEKLSGGEKQRVAIARALVNDPSLILADEPTANLASSHGRETMRLLRAIATERGRVVIIVSRDARIKEIADRVLWLEDGAFKSLVEIDVDPVCGMAVGRKTAVSGVRDGVTYYFCARGCMTEFLEQQSPREADRFAWGSPDRHDGTNAPEVSGRPASASRRSSYQDES
jgi:putative ABC transport system ATP-binding protein